MKSLPEPLHKPYKIICSCQNKLPAFHLLDSVIKKNSHYLKTFLPNIASLFCTVFKMAKKDVRSAMFQTRKSWAKLLPNDVLYCLDVNVSKMDPKWPILAHSNRTHANHKLVNASSQRNDLHQTRPLSPHKRRQSVLHPPYLLRCNNCSKKMVAKRMHQNLRLRHLHLNSKIFRPKIQT